MNKNLSEQTNSYTDLLAPLSDAQPCGSNLEYDPEFLLLTANATERPEAQYGDFVNTPESVNWSEVERDALRLLLRTKDIRILILLLRSRIRLAGASGLQEGLSLLEQMCTAWPQDIHPQIVADEETDLEDAALVRGNALAALTDPEGVLGDIRGIVISDNAALRLQVRDVERALSIPRPTDALAPDSVRRQLTDLRLRHNRALSAFDAASLALEKLQSWANNTLKNAAPDLSSLQKLMQHLQEYENHPAMKREAEDVPEKEPIQDTTLSEIPAAAQEADLLMCVRQPDIAVETQPIGIANRFDALERIENIRNWFETHEPSSPAIPLLRQAERMVGKRFSEVVEAIPLELLKQWDSLET